MDAPWTGRRPPRTPCRPPWCPAPNWAPSASRPSPGPGVPATRSAHVGSRTSASSSSAAAGSPPSGSRTRPGAPCRPPVTTRSSCSTPSPATPTWRGRRGRATAPPLVGRRRRARSRDRHRPVLRHRAERARRLPGHDRTVVGGAGRGRVGLAVPVRHGPRPGGDAGTTGGPARDRPVRGRRRRLDGRHARAGARGDPARARRTPGGPRDHGADHRRPDRRELAAACRDPDGPGLRRRRPPRRRARRGPAPWAGARTADGPDDLPRARRAERPLRPVVAERRLPLGDDGRFSVESYLDFHGNKFTAGSTPPRTWHSRTRWTPTTSVPAAAGWTQHWPA